MIGNSEPIRVVEVSKRLFAPDRKHFADCIILTHDYKILLQQRPDDNGRFSGALCAFGGHVEEGEAVIDALVREIGEELGGGVSPEDAVFLGAVTEDLSQHRDVVHIYFWHDRDHTISGCYEWSPRFYDRVDDVFEHPQIMDYLRWGLCQCQDKGLLE